MTISTEVNDVTHDGDGLQTSWPFQFNIPDDDSYEVLITAPTGAITVADPSTHSITGLNNEQGGFVDYPLDGPALASGYKLTINRKLSYTQPTKLRQQRRYDPQVVEETMDRLEMQIQQVNAKADRSVQVPISSDTLPENYLSDIEVLAAQAAASAADADADRIQTGLDRVATGQDRVQTGLDRNAAAASAGAAATSEANADADATATAADRVQTGLDRVATGQDKVATAADRVQTGLDKAATAADRVQTGLDRTQTGLDRSATGSDVTAADNARIAAEAARDVAIAQAAGMKWKNSVRAATTANRTLSGLTNTSLDGVTPIAGDRILVKNQTTTSQNGIYIAASGSWTRATDMDAWAEVPSATVAVEEGTTLADTIWICTSNSGGTIGSTAITFIQFSGASVSLQLDKFAGNGTAGPFALAGAPGTVNNVHVFVSGVYQTPGVDYSVTGTSLAFLAGAFPPAPVPGVTHNIMALYGQTQAINVPAAGSVQWSTLASSIIASVAEMLAGTANKIISAANLKSLMPNPHLQLVSAETTAVATITASIPLDDTIPQNTEGTQVLVSPSITPKAATSKLKITFSASLAHSGDAYTSMAIFRGAGANAIAAQIFPSGSASGRGQSCTAVFIVDAVDVAARTYAVRMGTSSGTLTINGAAGSRYFGGVCKTSLIVEEIGA